MSDVLDEQTVWAVMDRGAYRAKNAVRVVTVEQARAYADQRAEFAAGLRQAVVAGALLPFADHRFKDGKPCMVGSDQGCTCGYYEALKLAASSESGESGADPPAAGLDVLANRFESALNRIAGLGMDAPAFGGEQGDFYHDQLITAIGTAARALSNSQQSEPVDD